MHHACEHQLLNIVRIRSVYCVGSIALSSAFLKVLTVHRTYLDSLQTVLQWPRNQWPLQCLSGSPSPSSAPSPMLQMSATSHWRHKTAPPGHPPTASRLGPLSVRAAAEPRSGGPRKWGQSLASGPAKAPPPLTPHESSQPPQQVRLSPPTKRRSLVLS